MRKFVFTEKLPSGNYSVRHWNNGKFEREWFEDYALAKQREANLKLALLAKKQGQPDPTVRPIDILIKYLEAIKHTHRASTIKMKQEVLHPFCKEIQYLTEKRIKEWKQEMLGKLSVSTVSIRLRELRAMCNWARKESYLQENLFANIPIPAAKESGKKIDLDTMKKIFNAADLVAKPYMAFLIYTGARYGEICQAEWVLIDLDKGVWTIPAEHCKTKKARNVPLPSLLLSMLRIMPKKDGQVFPGWTKNTGRWYLNKACKKAGVASVNPHAFRHSFASHWTGDTRKLQDMLGWSTGAMLKRYSHFTVEDIRKEANEKGIAGSLQLENNTNV